MRQVLHERSDVESQVAEFVASCDGKPDPEAVLARVIHVAAHIPKSIPQSVVLVSKEGPPFFGVTTQRRPD